MTALVWYRRDLRVHDHPALRAATGEGEDVVPVFCLDDRLLHGRFASGPRTQFLLESLSDLDGALRARGGRLVVRHGPPERELSALAKEVGASEVHFTHDLTPYARAREKRVLESLHAAGVESRAHPGVSVADDVTEITTRRGTPHTVFSPFYRAWLDAPRRGVLAAPRKVRLPSKVRLGRIPRLEDLRLRQEVGDPLLGGETAGRRRLKGFLRGPVRSYASDHDALGEDRTSRLSAYLHFGCVSARELEDRLPSGKGADAFRRQLCWRDFHLHVIYRHPGNAREEMQERYRGSLAWSGGEREFRAWTEGRTGYPLVDAGMRQLRREGFMHNRARLVVGSFLTKDLGVDWRRGEAWFMRLLLDGDEANNNGNWQWVASVGTDPQPYYRRMYNPARHMARFDPDGAYVRRYVPELRDVPNRYLAEPWTMPGDVQRESGCVIGEDYPEPIVDRREAREAAAARYRAAAV